MCRVFGCVAAEPASIRYELLEADNPMIRQSEEHDSGWGMAVYERGDGSQPQLVRFPEAAYVDGDFRGATGTEGRIFNVHVRRATMGGLTLDPPGSLRRAMTTVVDRSPFSGLNFLFSDGECLYAYRLGIFELHWLARPGQLLVSSEKLTDEPWHTVQQDVLLVLDPDDLEEPHAERLLGEEVVARAEIRKFQEGAGLRGAERGAFAAERAARQTATANE